MNEEQQDEKLPSTNFMDEKIFKSRSISIFGNINERIARSVTEQLLALSAENNDPITIYISSPGGHVESGDVIYDMIKFIKPEVRVVGTGWVASAATNIYLAAKKENWFTSQAAVHGVTRRTSLSRWKKSLKPRNGSTRSSPMRRVGLLSRSERILIGTTGCLSEKRSITASFTRSSSR